LLFTGNVPNQRLRAYIQDLRGGAPVALPLAGHISPDGKYLTSIAGSKLFFVPVGDAAPRPTMDVQPGDDVIRWSADGRSLFLRRNEGSVAIRIVRLDLASGHEEPWKELKPADPVGVQMGQVVMTPDGNAYAYSFERDISTLYLADGLK
jgi:hypothetical protein